MKLKIKQISALNQLQKADDILKDLREMRDKKGADVKEHELIDKKNI